MRNMNISPIDLSIYRHLCNAFCCKRPDFRKNEAFGLDGGAIAVRREPGADAIASTKRNS